MQGDESSMLFELLTALIDLLIQVAEGLQVSCDVEDIFLIISDIQFISKTSTVIQLKCKCSWLIHIPYFQSLLLVQ